MTKNILLGTGLLVVGFVLGVVGINQNGNVLGGTTYDRSNLVGDVYQGIGGTLMMTGGELVGPIDTDTLASFDGGIAYIEDSETVTADNTLTIAESGLTTYISTTGTTTTLPAATAGAVFRFVVGAAFDTNNFIIDSAEGDNIEGSLIVAGAVVDCDAEDQVNFIADGENLGDFVELRSNDTKWFITQSNALTSAKLTCTDPT